MQMKRKSVKKILIVFNITVVKELALIRKIFSRNELNQHSFLDINIYINFENLFDFKKRNLIKAQTFEAQVFELSTQN